MDERQICAFADRADMTYATITKGHMTNWKNIHSLYHTPYAWILQVHTGHCAFVDHSHGIRFTSSLITEAAARDCSESSPC